MGKDQTAPGTKATVKQNIKTEDKMNNDKFFQAYVECALWSSTGDDGEPLDEDFGQEDIDPKSLESMRADCDTFIEQNHAVLMRAGSEEQSGHDFWLTRNRHGAGFWDRGYPAEVGRNLTEAAHAYGSCDLTVCDGVIFAN